MCYQSFNVDPHATVHIEATYRKQVTFGDDAKFQLKIGRDIFFQFAYIKIEIAFFKIQ